MAVEHESWRSIAEALGVQAISPFDLTIDGARVIFTALLPQFGGSAGMIVDPDWSIIEPHANALIREGYGYSCISIAGSLPPDMQGVLADWGWNGPAEEKPDWLTI
jgi:hypothetical protein